MAAPAYNRNISSKYLSLMEIAYSVIFNWLKRSLLRAATFEFAYHGRIMDNI